MSTFPLNIVTPEGILYNGEAQRLIVRTTEGDMAVLPRHINCVAPLAAGPAAITDTSGQIRSGYCRNGFLTVMDGRVCLISSDFRWCQAE